MIIAQTTPNREIQATAEHDHAHRPSCFVAAFVVATLTATADAQPITFNDPTPTNSDVFGGSLAVDRANVVIGAAGDATNGPNVGQAHLFEASTGNLLRTFDDPTITGYDQFGYSVALDGNNVLIGARLDNTFGDAVGQAHLFPVPELGTPDLLIVALLGLALGQSLRFGNSKS